MSKQQYRNKIDILYDILSAINESGLEGMKITQITRKANLGHYSTLNRCKNLEIQGLIQKITKNSHNLFVITEKGIETLQDFRN